jgi:hypothetical protein
MRELLLRLETPVTLPSRLRRLVEGGLVERLGCVFLKGEFRGVRGLAALDRTGRECFVNHVHIEDYVRKRTVVRVLSVGVEYASKLASLLRKACPRVPFRLVVGVDTHSKGCTVRFYRVRRGGPGWFASGLERCADPVMSLTPQEFLRLHRLLGSGFSDKLRRGRTSHT